MKERFTADEWERLERLPPLFFQFIALADQEVQPHEVETFVTELHDAVHYRDPLVRELFFDLTQADVFQKAWEKVNRIVRTSSDAIGAEIAGTRALLEANLSPEEYQRFFFVLIGVGMRIGASAGEEKKKGIFGRKKATPPELDVKEVQALGVLGTQFGVDLDAGQRALKQTA